MKKKISTKINQLEIYQFDAFPAILLEENSIILDNKRISSSRKITMNKKFNYEDYLKQLVIFRAKYEKPIEIPYSISDLDHFLETPAEKWSNHLASCHSKQNGFLFVPKEKFKEFEKKILALDFSRFDEEKANEISQEYSAKIEIKKVEVDAVAIEESMNERE